MDMCENTQEGAPPSEKGRFGKHKSQSKAQRNQPGAGNKPSWLSFKHNRSNDCGFNFPDISSGVKQIHQRLGSGSEHSCASFSNDQANGHHTHSKSSPSSGVERNDHCESPLLPEENETSNQNQTCSDFTPVVSPEKDGVLYSFRFSGSGLFQCSLTGLKFLITREGEVNYRTLIWDTTLLESRELQARGLLFNIESSPGTISQLHLPHCEHQPLSESLSVLHITDDSSLIKPEKITETHVVVNVPHLSNFGIVSTVRTFNLIPKKIKGQALLFLDDINNILSIHVILLPRNVPLYEVKEFHKDSMFIKVPSECVFKKNKTYICQSDPECFEIQPPRSKVHANYGPNYHPLFCLRLPLEHERRTKEVTVIIKDTHDQVIWQHKLPLPGMEERQQRGILFNTERLQRIRAAFIERVSGPTLDILLPKLCQCTVITPNEEEKVRELTSRLEKARTLVDIVIRKGERASSHLIQILMEEDGAVSETLELM